MTEGLSPHREPDRQDEGNVERAKRLVSHLDRAKYNAFQEYKLDVGKDNIGRPSRPGQSWEHRDPVYEDEMDRYERVLAPFNFPKIGGSASLPPFGNLYIQYGEQNGMYVVEGAGRIEHDSGNRENYTSFVLRFDEAGSQEEFLDWIESDTTVALGSVFDRAFNEYDTEGNLVKKNFPSANSTRKPENPLSNITEIIIRARPKAPDPKPGRRVMNWVRSLKRR